MIVWWILKIECASSKAETSAVLFYSMGVNESSWFSNPGHVCWPFEFTQTHEWNRKRAWNGLNRRFYVRMKWLHICCIREYRVSTSGWSNIGAGCKSRITPASWWAYLNKFRGAASYLKLSKFHRRPEKRGEQNQWKRERKKSEKDKNDKKARASKGPKVVSSQRSRRWFMRGTTHVVFLLN